MTGYESKRAAAQDKLAQPAQEPVAWMWRCKSYYDYPNWEVSLKRPADSGRDGNKKTDGYEDVPLYTAPPQRTEQCNYPDCKCPTENPCLKGLAQPAQEPVAMLFGSLPVYDTTPPQPKQEPVAWADIQKEAQQIVESKFLWKKFIDGTPLSNDIACWMADFAQQYTTPPQRTWVGLTDEEVDQGLLHSNYAMQTAGAWRDGVDWATKQLKEKNT